MDTLKKDNFILILKYIYLSLSLLCFYLTFCSTLQFIDNFFINIKHYLPILGVALLAFCKECNFKFNYKFLVLLVLSYFFGTCIGNNSIYDEYIILPILGIIFSNENPKTFMKFICLFHIVFVSICISLSYVNIFPNKIFYRGLEERHAFNFMHPNSVGLFLLSLYCLICYSFNKYRIMLIVVGLTITVFLFTYVDSRTSGLLIILVLLLHVINWLYKYITKSKTQHVPNLFCYIISFTPIILFVISLFLTIAYSPENTLLAKLNTILSTRLELQHNAYINYGFPLLGTQRQFFSSGTYDMIDSFYLFVVYKFGWLFQVLTLSTISFLITKKFKQSNFFPMLWITLVWSLYGISEPFCIYFCCNPFLILLFNNYITDKEVIND